MKVITNRNIILFGIKPTGQPHIGNYLCLTKILKMKGLMLYYIANLHALTKNCNTVIRRDVRLIASLFVSLLSINMLITYGFIQVQADALTSPCLSWLTMILSKFNNIEHVNMSKLRTNIGSLLYPSLMVADIIMINPTYVLVGSDQTKHLEYVNLIFNKFNKLFDMKYGNSQFIQTLRVIKTAKIISLQNIVGKMSKTNKCKLSIINMLDNYNIIKSKLFKVAISNDKLINNITGYSKIEINNLLYLYKHVVGCREEFLINRMKCYIIHDYKVIMSKLIFIKIHKSQDKIKTYLKHPNLIDCFLKTDKYYINK